MSGGGYNGDGSDLDTARNGEDALPPHNEESEWFLIACLLEKPSVIPAIDPEILYVAAARSCLESMKQALSLHLFCTDNPHSFLHHVQRNVDAARAPLEKAVTNLPSAEGWSYWHGVIMDCYKARCLEQLKPKITEVSRRVARGDSPNEVLFELQKISRHWHGSRAKTSAELMPEVTDFLEYAYRNDGKFPGEVTGLHRLDKMVCGFQPGKLYDIAGRPGHGKSSLVSCMAIGFARRGVKVGIISLEMLSTEIVSRMVSSEARVPLVKFLRATADHDETNRAALMMQQIAALPLVVTDQLRTLSEIVMAMHEQAAQGVRVLIVDYLQKINIPRFRSSRNELVTEISGAMKEMAISLKLPVICCAQLNRESEKQEREPTMADLRDSGSLEQDADFIGLIYSNGKCTDPDHVGAEQTDLIVVKNRSGDTGRLTMAFRKAIFRFDEVA